MKEKVLSSTDMPRQLGTNVYTLGRRKPSSRGSMNYGQKWRKETGKYMWVNQNTLTV